MKTILKMLAFLLTFTSSLSSIAAQDKCSDVLKDGIFNVTTVNQSEGIKNDFTTWICTTDFGTHQEAIDSGISIGFPVYGVPVKLGGTFSKAERDTWKRTNCSATIDKSTYSASYQKVVSEVSPIVVNAWRDCMIARQESKIGLGAVALSRGTQQVAFKVRWLPYDGFDTRLPKVTGYSMIGAKQATVGATLFKVGVNVPATETIIDFTRNSSQTPVTITLNTDRGAVTAYVPPQTMRLIVSAELKPNVEQREVQSKVSRLYARTPNDDCVKRVGFRNTFYPPDGFTFISHSIGEKTRIGTRTGVNYFREGNGITGEGAVQGDDGFGGFCKNPGELDVDITVTGERWARAELTKFPTGEKTLDPLQETYVIPYPYLQSMVDKRDFRMTYVATIKKVIGDDVSVVQLTDGANNSSGIKATADGSGNLIIDASAAFASWRSSLNP